MIPHIGGAPIDKRSKRYRNAVVPHIYVEGAATAITFFERAFRAGAVPVSGKIVHGEIAIGPGSTSGERL